MSFLSNLRERWDDWCGDREMEQSIRQFLSETGFYGKTAKLSRIRLSAVARPGWIQIYQFDARARRQVDEPVEGPDPDAIYDEVFGLLRDDARGEETKIEVFATSEDRIAQLDQWSEGLIRTRAARRS